MMILIRTAANICIVIVCLVCPAGCVKSPTAASISGNIYKNRYFGFSIKIPDGWTVMDGDMSDSGLQSRAKTIAWSHGLSEDSLRSKTSETYQLLSIYRDAAANSAEGMSSITIGAVKVPPGSGKKAGRDLLAQLVEVMGQGKISYKSLGGILECDFGGRQFYRADFSIVIQDTELYQAYLACSIDEYALIFVVTGIGRDSLNDLVRKADGLLDTRG